MPDAENTVAPRLFTDNRPSNSYWKDVGGALAE